MRDQNGRTVHDLGVERGRLADGDVFLPLSLCQGAGHFIDEEGGSEEFMDLPLVFVAQPDRFRRERAGNDPADRDGSVKDVLHASSSSWSNAWNRASSMTPRVRRISSVIRSARSSMRRDVSGSTGVPSIMRFITASRSARTCRSMPAVSAILI